MKKLLLVLVIGASFAACNNNADTKSGTDTAAVAAPDTTAKMSSDTTKKGDTTITKTTDTTIKK